MEAQLHITAHSRSEVEAALAELQMHFAGRLTVIQAVMCSLDGAWSAVARLDSNAYWFPSCATTVDHMPDITHALQSFDAALGQEMDATDYPQIYGFDLAGMLMHDARVDYNTQAARPELYIQTRLGDVTVWRDHYAWTICYPPMIPKATVTAETGHLIATLYNVMHILLEGP